MNQIEKRFDPKEGKTGWTVYRSLDKKNGDISTMQYQVIRVDRDRYWYETSVITPSSKSVILYLINHGDQNKVKMRDGNEYPVKFERQIFWSSSLGESEARESSDEEISRLNAAGKFMLNNLFVTKELNEKRSAKTPAGSFRDCFVDDESEIPFLRESVKACKSGLIPAPYLVEAESNSSRTELFSYGFDKRPSLLPASIKVKKNSSY